jgi:hypothetical protein
MFLKIITIKQKVVPVPNAIMANVSNIRLIQIILFFVDVIQDGLDDFVQLNILVIVHRFPNVLVVLPVIDLSAFVRSINLVLDVFLPIQYVRITQPVKMVVNVLEMMNI